MNLLQEVKSALAPVLAKLLPDVATLPNYLGMVKPTTSAEHGDYQANFAMPLAKVLSKKPHDVAKLIIDAIPANNVIQSASVAGPGFINIKLNDEYIAAQIRKIAIDERLGVSNSQKPLTYVIDYSGPNVAKPLHVGHLRSTIIGDALVRILRFLGHKVIGDNHLGDWGTQFGMLIYGYRTFLDQKAYEADAVRELARLYVQVRRVSETIDIISNAYTNFRDVASYEASPVTELTRLYVNGLKRAKTNEEDGDDERKGPPFPNPIADSFRNETAKLHAGDKENLALWQKFMKPCLDAIHHVYLKLELLPIDNELGESYYHPLLANVVADLLAKGIAVESQGAVVIPNAKGVIPKTEEEFAKEEPPALIRKRDGAFTYTTTDLATIKHRMETWTPNVMLYVVDARQALHFKTLFANASRWQYSNVEFHHLAFGSVLGKDGKPFKTRDGGTIELSDLIDTATDLGGRLFELIHWRRAARGHDVPDWETITPEEKADIASAVGVGAIKYADLSGNRASDYRFDYDKMLSTEGNTATYMQYAYARCRSIFRRGNADAQAFRTNPPDVAFTHAAERTLALQLLKFEEVLAEVSAKYEPHHICAYLWDLAKAFSVFFENCPVLTAPSEELRQSRLLLVDLTARTIHQALDLLGIRTVERM